MVHNVMNSQLIKKNLFWNHHEKFSLYAKFLQNLRNWVAKSNFFGLVDME